MAGEVSIGSLYVSIGAKTNKLRAAEAEVRASSAAMTSGLAGVRQMAGLVSGALAAIGVGFSLKKATDEVIGFDSALTQSLSIMGDVSDTMRNQMAREANDVAKALGIANSEAAKSYYYLASAGLDANQSLKALPVTAEFAKAGMFDMARATDLLTDAQSALGLTIKNDAVANMENMIRISDVLVRANVLANASVEQFSEALTNKAAARSRSLNIALEETVAALADLADQGKKGRVAGEELNILLRDLNVAATQNGDAFEALGIHVFDAQGRFRHLADIIDDMTGALSGLSDKEKAQVFDMLGLTAQAGDVANIFLGTSDKIRGYQDALEKAGGTTKDVADRQMSALGEKFGQLKASATALAVDLADSGPADFLGRIVSGATDAINSMDDLVNSMRGADAALEELLAKAPKRSNINPAVSAWFSNAFGGSGDAAAPPAPQPTNQIPPQAPIDFSNIKVFMAPTVNAFGESQSDAAGGNALDALNAAEAHVKKLGDEAVKTGQQVDKTREALHKLLAEQEDGSGSKKAAKALPDASKALEAANQEIERRQNAQDDFVASLEMQNRVQQLINDGHVTEARQVEALFELERQVGEVKGVERQKIFDLIAANQQLIDDEKTRQETERLMNAQLQEQRRLGDAIGGAFSNAFESAITGTNTLKQAVIGLAGELARAVLQYELLSPLRDSLTSKFGGLGAGATWFSSIAGLFSGVKVGSTSAGYGFGTNAAVGAASGAGASAGIGDVLGLGLAGSGIESTVPVAVLAGGSAAPAQSTAGKAKQMALTIINQITPEAVASAVDSDPGRGVIINTINQDALNNGVTRQTIQMA